MFVKPGGIDRASKGDYNLNCSYQNQKEVLTWI